MLAGLPGRAVPHGGEPPGRAALLAGPGAARRHPAARRLPPAAAAAAHRALRSLRGHRRRRLPAASSPAAPRRRRGGEDTWINPEIERLFLALHRQGHAHSVEVWQDGRLVGGLYGVVLGGAFFGESMFSRARDASKVALVHLVARLRLGGFILLDTQFLTAHLSQFGAHEVPRADYKRRLANAAAAVAAIGRRRRTRRRWSRRSARCAAGRRARVERGGRAKPAGAAASGRRPRRQTRVPVRRRHRGRRCFPPSRRQCRAASRRSWRCTCRTGAMVADVTYGGGVFWRRVPPGAIPAAGDATSPPAPIAAPCPTRRAASTRWCSTRPIWRGCCAPRRRRAAARAAMARCAAPIPAGGRRGAGPRALAPGGAGPLPRCGGGGAAGAARPRHPHRQMPGRGQRQPAGADACADRLRASRAGLLRPRPFRAGAAEPARCRAAAAAGACAEEPQLFPGFPEGAGGRGRGALPDAGLAGGSRRSRSRLRQHRRCDGRGSP